VSIITPFAHPDGDLIEVEVRDLEGEIVISDRGETLRHLVTLGYDPRTKTHSQAIIDDILVQYHVELYRGSLRARCKPSDIGKTLHAVTMACQAVAQMIYHAQASPANKDRCG
jgi:hypothetical protein